MSRDDTHKHSGGDDVGAVPQVDSNAVEVLLERARTIMTRKPLPSAPENVAEAERLEKHLNDLDERRGSRRDQARR